jgi:hypothetical protein
MAEVFECTPTNLNRVLELFKNAHHPEYAAQVLEQLSALNNFSGFRTVLLKIITNEQIDKRARTFAAAYLKNTLRDWWLRHPTHQDGKEQERAALRGEVFQALVSSNDDDITTVLSDALSTIALIDFPQHWPDFGQFVFHCLEQTVVKQTDQNGIITSLTLNITPNQDQYKILQLSLRLFDTLSLTVNDFHGRPDSLQLLNQILITPFLPISYQFWVLFAGLISQLAPQAVEQINNTQYITTFTLLLRLVREITSFLSKCVQLQPEPVLALQNGQLADQIFQSFGQCISTFQNYVNLLPSHNNSIAIRNNLNTIRGHCCSCISQCITLSPVLFRKYLQSYADLFFNILISRGNEREQELNQLAVQHGAGECGVCVDEEDESDLTIKGKDICIINSFGFLSKIISNPSYAIVGANQHSNTKNIQTNALLSLQARQLGYENTLQATHIALNLMNDEWCLKLTNLIVQKFTSLIRWDINQICNYGNEYYFDQNEANALANERKAALDCLRKLWGRNPNLIMGHLLNMLNSVKDQIPVLVDSPFQVSTPQNVPQSQLILHSWQVDSVLYALRALLESSGTLIEQLDHVSLAGSIAATLQGFLASIHAPQQQNCIVGEGSLQKIPFEAAPTTFQRIIACLEVLQYLAQYLDSNQNSQIWGLIIPFFLIDNIFLKLTVASTIQVFADMLGLVNSSDPSIDHKTIEVIEHSVRGLILYGISIDGVDTETRVVFLDGLKATISTLSMNSLIPILPSIIPSLSQLWKRYFHEENEVTIANLLIYIIQNLVTGLGTAAVLLDSVVLTILPHALGEEPGMVFDAGLALLEAYLNNVPYLTDPLIKLFQLWVDNVNNYPDLFQDSLYPVLISYLHLAGYLHPQMKELKSDVNDAYGQITTTFAQALPQNVQQLAVIFPRPAEANFLVNYMEKILNSLLVVFSNTHQKDHLLIFHSLDLILRCVDCNVLFTIPTFGQLLSSITYMVVPAMYYSLASTGFPSQCNNSKSALFYTPPRTKEDFANLALRSYGLEHFDELPEKNMVLILSLFSRLLIQSPEQFISLMTSQNIPNPDNQQTPIWMSTPLNLFLSMCVLMCDEEYVGELFLRKQFSLVLAQSFAIYQYAIQQLQPINNQPNNQHTSHLSAFVNLIDCIDYTQNLLIALLRECGEDEVAENRFIPSPTEPLQLSDPSQFENEFMCRRRNNIISNYDITAVVRTKDRVMQFLNLCSQFKGQKVAEGLMYGVPLGILYGVDMGPQ